MKTRPVVGFREAITVGTVFMSAKIFLSYQLHLYHVAANAAWVIPPIESVIALAGLLLLVAVLDRHPGKSIVEISEAELGPFFNTLFSMVFASILIIITGLVLRQSGERAVTGFYPDTPISVVVLLFIAGTVTVTYLGFDIIARVASLTAPFLALGLALIVGLSVPLWQTSAIFPLFGTGVKEVLLGSLQQTGYFTEMFILGVAAPFFPRGKLRSIGLWTIGISTILLTGFILIPLLVFNYPVVTELSLPLFELNRLISVGRFGQRMETIFLPIWALSGLIKLSVGLYGAADVIAQTLKLQDYRPFILPMAVFTLAIAFIPPNVSAAVAFDLDIIRRYSFIVVMAMFLPVIAITYLRGRGNKSAGENN